MRKKYFTAVFAVLFVSSSVVCAYIDPGTGAYIASGLGPALWGLILAAAGFIVGLFRRIIIEKARRHKKLALIIILAVVVGAYVLYSNITRETGIVKSGGLVGGKGLEDAAGILKENQKVVENVAVKEKRGVLFDESLSGARVYDRGKIQEGYNVFEGKIMNLEGKILKNFSSIHLSVLDDDGFYYAQEYYESEKFAKFSFNDEVVWEKDTPIPHNILVTEEGSIITFTKEVHDYNGRDVEFDIIVEYSADGQELSRWSTWDNLEKLKKFHRRLELDQASHKQIPDAHRLNKSVWGGHYDYYHLNYLQLLPETPLSSKYDAFRGSNWLISFRHGSMIFILDQDTKDVVWRAIYDQVEGNLEGQHSPQMLSNGRILVFDNGRYRNFSRVIELDPVTLEVVWEYKDKDFFTLSQGHAQRLSNGNTLITESEKGRVFEVTREGEVVWEYYHPEIQGPKNSKNKDKWGQRQEIYRMERYPKEFIEGLLQ